MATCGICQQKQLLVAVLVDDLGTAHPPLGIGCSDDERQWLLDYLLEETQGRPCELVLLDWLLRSDPISQMALARGSMVWMAPAWLLDAIAAVTSQTTVPMKRKAAFLARLPLVPKFRPFLRRFEGAIDKRQRQIALL
jgi:hypothetical protein